MLLHPCSFHFFHFFFQLWGSALDQQELTCNLCMSIPQIKAEVLTCGRYECKGWICSETCYPGLLRKWRQEQAILCPFCNIQGPFRRDYWITDGLATHQSRYGVQCQDCRQAVTFPYHQYLCDSRQTTCKSCRLSFATRSEALTHMELCCSVSDNFFSH